MKLWFKTFLLACGFAGAAFTAQAQVLSPVGVTVTPDTAAPGEAVSVVVDVENGGAIFGPGETADFTAVFTHRITGASFTFTATNVAPSSGIIGPATVDPTSGQTTPGTGTFSLPARTIPISTTEAGAYSVSVTIDSVSDVAASIGNSTYFSGGTSLTVTGKPDLQITGLTYPAGTSYVGGEEIPMTLSYRNNGGTNGTRNVPYTPGTNSMPDFVRIQVVLSTNPQYGDADDFQLTIHDIRGGNFGSNLTFDNAGNPALMADGSIHTFTWNQILPGNFSGSYYVLAKIDSLNALDENDAADLTVNGNNIWASNSLNPSATLINLLPSNFPTTYLASHKAGVTTTSDGYSDNPSITADGRYVAFASDATNLVEADANAKRDIFLFDSQTSLVRRLSLSQQGVEANAASNSPAVSANGRYVAFESLATNLLVGDANGFSDIFVVDTITGHIVRVSGINATGGQANNPSFRPSISSTGRYVVFESTATNLTATATTPGVSHIYLHDRDVANTGTFDTAGNTSTRLVDVSADLPLSGFGNANAIQAKISTDGTLIAFASKATNLVAPSTTVGRQHVYVRERANVGTANSGIKLISVANATAAEGDAHSQTPSLSADGRFIAFASLATNLIGTDDTNSVSDVFVYDNTAAATAPVVRRVSIPDPSTGLTQATDPSVIAPQDQRLGSINPTISADGRYIAFASLADNLTRGDSNGQAQATDANQALDIFVHDRDAGSTTPDGAGDPDNYDTTTATTLVSRNPFGYQTNGLLGVPSTAASNIYPVLSADGRFVAFPSDAENVSGLAFGATNLLSLDSNNRRDIFLADRRTTANITEPTLPSVAITSPGSTNVVLVNTPVTVAASATTTVGVVSSVQFFANGTSLASTSTFPYSTTWTPTAVGTYHLSALVTDSFGNIGVSANVPVTVRAAPTVSVTAPAPAARLTVGVVQAITASAAASNPGAIIASVEFFANNVSVGTDTSEPYSVNWTPSAAGAYELKAVATDSFSTQTTSSIVSVSVGSSPTVTLSNPAAGTSFLVNSTVPITANTAGGYGLITKVDFLVNGSLLSSDTEAPHTVNWTPASAGTYSLSAVVTDAAGFTSSSTPFTVTVLPNAGPTISLTSPASGSSIVVGGSLTMNATASDVDGSVTGVTFLANSAAFASDSGSPFTATWTPTAAGTYSLTAQATDNSGNIGTSAAVTVVVTANQPPTVSLTSPASGSAINLNTNVNLTANAGDSDGTISSVQFFANGIALGGADTAAPYASTWTPTSEGVYRLTAVATDSAGTATASSPVMVLATMNTVENSETIYSGIYVGPSDSGNFVAINLRGKSATFIAYSTSGPAKSYLYTDIPVASGRAFELKDDDGKTLISGSFNDSGASGTFGDGALTFVGPIETQSSSSAATGYYNGNITGRAGSALTGILGANGQLTVYLQDGTVRDAGAGVVDASGAFAITTRAGNKLTGTADPATGFLAGTATGAVSGTFTGALASGGTTSDGILRGLSTRGFVSTGDNILIAGFVVEGSEPKELLIRGIGPSLGIANSLPNPRLGLYSGSILVASNDNWGTPVGDGSSAAAIVAATAQVGLGALNAASNDAVILRTVNPGIYTAQLGDVGGATGNALLEVYDLSTPTPFTGEKVYAISTRGYVNGNGNELIAGFIITGSSPKKVLVQAVGPALPANGKLSDPVLQIVQMKSGGQVLVRENNDWSIGNDATLVAAAAASSGANALAEGSKDAAILITLPPGIYTAVVSGAGGASGIALVNVYEVR